MNINNDIAEESVENGLYKRITDILLTIGMPPHINGFHFLREAIRLASGNFEMISGVTKKLYPLVAQHFDTTVTTIEQGIRNAIAILWSRGRPQCLDSILGMKVYDENSRPTSAEFIALISERVHLDCL